MKKIMIALTVMFLTLACGLTASPSSLPTKTRLPATPTRGNPVQPAVPSGELTGMTRLSLERSGGDFLTQVRRHMEEASHLGQVPYIEFTANW
jgi:hypothetical protein